jgi:hypothetical protein
MSSAIHAALSFRFLAFAVISMNMSAPVRASASIVAAGVVAILSGAFAALIMVASFAIIARTDFSAYGVALTPAMRSILYFTWAFFLLGACFVLVSGIYVIRLRNWARLSILTFAGCGLFFGVVGVGVIFVMVYFQPNDPLVSKSVLASVLGFTYGIPTLVAVWWLLLFTRRSVVAQFHASTTVGGESTSAPPSVLNNPECPLGIRIIGWYLASFILFLPFIPFLTSHLPALYFGHLFRGPSAVLAHLLSCVLFAVPGIGLLVLKRWSYPIAFVTQLLLCINCLVIAFSSSFEANMRAAYAELGVPAPSGTGTLLVEIRYILLASLIIPVAILVVLYLYRRPFHAAADRVSEKSSAN